VDNAVMMLSLLPYLLFLYLIWLLHPITIIGFVAMLGFIAVTATTGFIALKVIGAKTLAHADALHGIAEGALTITNGLIVFGLKKQLDKINKAEAAEEEEESPVTAGYR
jgi:hypothetical protein